MAKLTDRQRKRIIAEYIDGDGKVSQKSLAQKYGVSESAIRKVLSDEKVRKSADIKKEENLQDMLAFLDSRKKSAQQLIDLIMAEMPESIRKASLREKSGALKILSEVFSVKTEQTSTDTGIDVQIVIADTSKKDNDK